MGPKKCRRVRKIEIPTDTPTEFELRGAVADIQQRKEEGGEGGKRNGGRGTKTGQP